MCGGRGVDQVAKHRSALEHAGLAGRISASQVSGPTSRRCWVISQRCASRSAMRAWRRPHGGRAARRPPSHPLRQLARRSPRRRRRDSTFELFRASHGARRGRGTRGSAHAASARSTGGRRLRARPASLIGRQGCRGRWRSWLPTIAAEHAGHRRQDRRCRRCSGRPRHTRGRWPAPGAGPLPRDGSRPGAAACRPCGAAPRAGRQPPARESPALVAPARGMERDG